MSLFSRCEASQAFEPFLRLAAPRRARARAAGGLRHAVAGFAEDIGILIRYAAGLDYYDRAGLGR